MTKTEKRGPGRPPKGTRAMKQIAIRLPDDMLDQVDDIIAERFGLPDRTAVIRELVAEALAARKRKAGRQ